MAENIVRLCAFFELMLDDKLDVYSFGRYNPV